MERLNQVKTQVEIDLKILSLLQIWHEDDERSVMEDEEEKEKKLNQVKTQVEID